MDFPIFKIDRVRDGKREVAFVVRGYTAYALLASLFVAILICAYGLVLVGKGLFGGSL